MSGGVPLQAFLSQHELTAGAAFASATSASATTQRARQLLVGAEAARGEPQELAGARGWSPSWAMAMPRRAQRRRVVAQGDPLEGAEGIAGGEGARGSGDQGVHDDRLPRRTDVG